MCRYNKKRKKGLRTIVFDEDLCIEAYRLEGYVDAFPVHCHDFYVFGFVYGGQRALVCKQKEFVLSKGDIVIFNPDEMRVDSMSHMGNRAARTPNLDKFAREEAVSFSNAFCQNPVCVPSRCSFMTGLYPHTNGHRTMSYLLHRGEDSLLKELKDSG